jgi:hypothetical protein
VAISLSINTPDYLLISIAPTKPDRSTICTVKTLFSRKSVPRTSQKGDLTNLFYALNIIRLRIGKFHERNFRHHRKIEHVTSLARKILSSKDASPAHIYAAIEKILLFLGKPLDTSKLAPMEMLENLVYKELYEMDFSTWHPTQLINSLIESLRTNGPMILTTSLKTPGHKHSLITHKIVVVGAQILSPTEGLVYYLDPIDGGHTVYTVPYDTFSSHAIHITKSDESSVEEALEATYWGWQNPI